MVDNLARLDACGVAYYPYVEPHGGAGKGLLEALARRAALVVTDDYPAFFLPRMLEAAGRIRRRLEAVDSNGIVPMRAARRTFATAHAFRRHLHGHLPTHFGHLPAPDPLAAIPRGGRSRAWPGGRPGAAHGHPARIPPAILSRWPRADLSRATSGSSRISRSTTRWGPVELRGGAIRAQERLATFLDHGFERYAGDRNHPERDATSRLSPYLHFGHISAHEILARIAEREAWTPARGRRRRTGAQGRLVGNERRRGGLPGPAGHLAGTRVQPVRTCRRLRFVRGAARVGAQDAGRTRRGPAGVDLRAQRTSRRPAPTIRCGTPRRTSSGARAGSTTICACFGARRSWNGAPVPALR